MLIPYTYNYVLVSFIASWLMNSIGLSVRIPSSITIVALAIIIFVQMKKQIYIQASKTNQKMLIN